MQYPHCLFSYPKPSIDDLHTHTHTHQGPGDKFYFNQDAHDSTKVGIYTNIDGTDYYLQLTPDGENRIDALSVLPQQYNFVFPAR